LLSALKTVADGGEIILRSGDYGRLDLNRLKFGYREFAQNVTIRSEDSEDQASFSGLFLKNMKNLTFADVVVDYKASAGAALWVRSTLIEDSKNITFKGVTFDGDLATGRNAIENGHGTGIGLLTTRVEGLTVQDSEFFNWHRAIVIGGGVNFVIRGNDIHSIRSDGINVGGAKRVLIENNHIHDFDIAEGSTDHPDMIQFMNTSGAARPEGIVIRGNLLDSGDGGATQSIFMRNEAVDRGLVGTAGYYRDVTIVDNVIRNAHAHGITLGQADGATIANNTVLHNVETASGPSVTIPRITVHTASRDVEISRNVAHAISPTGPGWTVEDNLIVQRTSPGRANYYGDLFVDALVDPDEAAALQALPGSVITREGLGAAATRFDATPEALTALARTALDAAEDYAVLFDGRLSADAGGFVAGRGASFLWTFGDGTVATGPTARHVYDGHGSYEVRLQVTAADGSVDVVDTEVRLQDLQLLAIDAGRGMVDLSSHAAALTASRVAIVGDAERGKAFAMTASASIALSAKDSEILFDREAFSLSFAIDAAKPGELFRIHSSMRASIDAGGELRFTMTNAEGRFFGVTTKGADLLDGGWRDVTLVFDGRDDGLSVYVDGRLAGAAAAEGATKPRESWGLNIGRAWGTAGVEGRLDDVELRGDVLTVAEIAARHGQPSAALSAPPETEAPEAPFADGLESALVQGGAGPRVVEHEGWIETADQFSFRVDIDRDAGDAPTAGLFGKAGDFAVGFQGDDLVVQVTTASGGSTRLTAADLGWGEKRIGLSLDEDANRIAVYVDGRLAAQQSRVDIAFSGGPASPLTLEGPAVGEIGALIVSNAVHAPDWF
jgi:PKD repeat protein